MEKPRSPSSKTLTNLQHIRVQTLLKKVVKIRVNKNNILWRELKRRCYIRQFSRLPDSLNATYTWNVVQSSLHKTCLSQLDSTITASLVLLLHVTSYIFVFLGWRIIHPEGCFAALSFCLASTNKTTSCTSRLCFLGGKSPTETTRENEILQEIRCQPMLPSLYILQQRGCLLPSAK